MSGGLTNPSMLVDSVTTVARLQSVVVEGNLELQGCQRKERHVHFLLGAGNE